MKKAYIIKATVQEPRMFTQPRQVTILADLDPDDYDFVKHVTRFVQSLLGTDKPIELDITRKETMK